METEVSSSDYVDDEILVWDELYEVADAIRLADQAEKKGKAQKEGLRGAYFALISEIIRNEVPLATQTVVVEGDFDLDSWRAREYPEWRVVGVDNSPEGTVITLEENEDFKKFEFVYGGYKFGRQIRFKGAGFDAEAFYTAVSDGLSGDEETDELGLELLSCVTLQLVPTYELDEAKAMKIMADHPETVTLFQEHTNPGTPEPALLPIRVAKEEDE